MDVTDRLKNQLGIKLNEIINLRYI
jgi:hypothetical protein